jgi:hypothetical protein
MAWSNPHDFTPGEMVTHTMMNAIRDNLKETAPHKASAAGFPYASGANALAFAANKTLRATSAYNAVEAAGYPFRQAPISESLDSGIFPLASADDVLEAEITTTGGKVVVMGYAWVTEVLLSGGSGPRCEHHIYLRRDSTDLVSRNSEQHADVQYTWTSNAGFIYVDSQAAGTYTYKIRGYSVNTDRNTTYQPTGPAVIAYLHLWEI